MGHNYGGIVSPRADVVKLGMVDSFDKRHLEWLVSDEEIRLNEFVESSFGKEFADADQALKETIAQRLNYARRFDYGLYADNASDFTDGQIKTIWTFLDRQVEKHLKLDRVEAAILDENNKNLYFMWGKIKREYPKSDTFAWSTKLASERCGCSKSDVGPIMKKLEKLGAVTLIQKGKAGKHSGRATIYRREV